MYFYFWYVNHYEHFDNVIYLTKKQFVVRVGKTCNDALTLYIALERKGGGELDKILHTPNQTLTNTKKIQKDCVTII